MTSSQMNNPAGIISAAGLVTKLSSSDVGASINFYTSILGFAVDNRYTININSSWAAGSYVQLYTTGGVTIGLFKDIDHRFGAFDADNPPPGTAPTLMVADVTEAVRHLADNQIPVGSIIKSTSDAGYTDQIAFFPDPDNNMLVIRQNLDGNT